MGVLNLVRSLFGRRGIFILQNKEGENTLLNLYNEIRIHIVY